MPTEFIIDPYYATEEWIALRKAVVEAAFAVCAYCGGEGFQADHVTPRKKGGRDARENLVCCCARCNRLFANQVFPNFEQKKAWMTDLLRKRDEKERRIPSPCKYKRISKYRGCAAPAIPGSVYCAEHHALVVKKGRPKIGNHRCDYKSAARDRCPARAIVQVGRKYFCESHAR